MRPCTFRPGLFAYRSWSACASPCVCGRKLSGSQVSISRGEKSRETLGLDDWGHHVKNTTLFSQPRVHGWDCMMRQSWESLQTSQTLSHLSLRYQGQSDWWCADNKMAWHNSFHNNHCHLIFFPFLKYLLIFFPDGKKLSLNRSRLFAALLASTFFC